MGVLQRDYLVDLRGVIEEGRLLAVVHAPFVNNKICQYTKIDHLTYTAVPVAGTPHYPTLWLSLCPASTAGIPRCSRIA